LQNESAPAPAVGTGALDLFLMLQSQLEMLTCSGNRFHVVWVLQQQQHIAPRLEAADLIGDGAKKE
jgi:hypothetical protein